MSRVLRLTAFILLMTVLAAALWVFFTPAVWQLRGDEFLPVNGQGAAPQPPDRQADLDGDGGLECLDMRGRRFAIRDCAGGQVAWQSPPAWRVWQAAVSDLDRDGAPEAVLLVWRPFAPWPVDQVMPHGGRITSHQNIWGRSCHVILVGYRGGRWRELWAGSALARPLLALAPADLDGDGWQELAALETRYSPLQVPPAGGLAVWQWNGFGFDLVARRPGVYFDLRVVEVNGSSLLKTR